MKQAILIFTVSVLAAGALASSAVSGKANVSRDSGISVDTYFTSTAAGVLTNVNIWGSDTRVGQPGGPASRSRTLNVFILQKDLATDEILLDVNAYVELDPGVLAVDPRISRADLHLVVEGVDGVSGRSVQIAVDLTVVGVGALERTRQRIHFVDEEVILNAHGNSRVRMAEAVASVAIDGVEYTPGPAFFAYLARSSGGDVVIVR